MKRNKPKIAITMGDPAGIGPEIIMKVLAEPRVYEFCRPIVVGSRKMLERAAQVLGSALKISSAAKPEDGQYRHGVIDCLDLDLVEEDLPFGEISAQAGNAAFQFLKYAIELALAGEVAAICTAPLNKASLNLAGHKYAGHTEILAEFAASKNYAMMLTSPQLKVIHVTTHMGLIAAIQSITTERIYDVIALGQTALTKMGIAKPRIAVSGINPHAGEDGLFGNEEERIVPAIRLAQKQGMRAYGPIPPDTVFYQATKGEYDLVVAMYHDQGHIPIKVLGFEAGVNVTVGLPFVRTSVDHGTAFDIAGQGIASETSLFEALIQAVRLLGHDVRAT